MSQVDLPTSVGYAMKKATVALRVAMDSALRDIDLSVSQYSALELLMQRPGLSNADLARGVFVTRQATHQLLSGLRHADLIEIVGVGRQQRVSLTEVGARRLAQASRMVASIEKQMLAGLSSEQQTELHGSLIACAQALAEPGD